MNDVTLRTIHEIELRLVRPCGLRQARSSNFAVDDLLPSMEAHGLIHPIWVRSRPLSPPDPELGDVLYEIVQGERRALTATRLKWKTISAEIRDDLTDLDVYLIHLEENDRRRALTPLEQADAVDRLMRPVEDEGFGIQDTAELAVRLGISISTVHQRIGAARASKRVRELYDQGKIYFGSLLAIASLHSESAQEEAAEACLPAPGEDPYPVRRVQHLVQDRFHLRLADAEFDTKITLAGVVPCEGCPKRAGSDAQQSLFDVGADVLSPTTDARCTDAACFKAKRIAWRDMRCAEARAKGVQIIEGREGAELYPAGRLLGKAPYYDADVCPSGGEGRTYRQLVGAKLTCVALAVDGDDRCHDLYDRESVRAIVAGQIGPAAAPGPAASPTPEPEPAAKARAKASAPLPPKPNDESALLRSGQEAAGIEMLGEIVLRAERRAVNAKSYRFVARGLSLLLGEERLAPIVERREIVVDTTNASAVISVLDALNESELWGMICEMVAASSGMHPSPDEADSHALAVACRFFGVDMDAAIKAHVKRLKRGPTESTPAAAAAKIDKGVEDKCCSVCTCTEEDPCFDDNQDPCAWADPDQTICSFCACAQASASKILASKPQGLQADELVQAILVECTDDVFDEERIDAALADAVRRKRLRRDKGLFKSVVTVVPKPENAGATPADEPLSLREQIIALLHKSADRSSDRQTLLKALKPTPPSTILREIVGLTTDKFVVTDDDKRIRLLSPSYEDVIDSLEALPLAKVKARYLGTFGTAAPTGAKIDDLRASIARKMSGQRPTPKGS